MYIEFVEDRYRSVPSQFNRQVVEVPRFAYLPKGAAGKCYVLEVDEVLNVRMLAAYRPGYGWERTQVFRRGADWFVYPGQSMPADVAAAVVAEKTIIAQAQPGNGGECVFVTPAEADAKVAAGDLATYFAADIEAAENRRHAAAVRSAWLEAGERGDTAAADRLLGRMPAYLAFPAKELLAAHPFADACRLIAGQYS